MYCCQADVNVSLTAMGLLWNAADLLSKMQLQSEAASGGSEAPTLSSADFEELLRLLLGALQVLACVFSYSSLLLLSYEPCQQQMPAAPACSGQAVVLRTAFDTATTSAKCSSP